jgi:hypothetical protein
MYAFIHADFSFMLLRLLLLPLLLLLLGHPVSLDSCVQAFPGHCHHHRRIQPS